MQLHPVMVIRHCKHKFSGEFSGLLWRVVIELLSPITECFSFVIHFLLATSGP